jgi:hypothetical protein
MLRGNFKRTFLVEGCIFQAFPKLLGLKKWVLRQFSTFEIASFGRCAAMCFRSLDRTNLEYPRVGGTIWSAL